MTISGSEMKTKGVSAIEKSLAQSNELLITARGEKSFVIMGMEQYNYLRECELEAALNQAMADVEAGRYVAESVDEHIKRVTQD